MQLLIFRTDGTDAVTRSLEDFLKKQRYDVIVAGTVEQAVAAANSAKLRLAFIPTRLDRAQETLELMQTLSLLGVPAVMINGHEPGYNAEDDKVLARALSRFARRGSGNGNGRHK